jgi:diguanylate cyclase (GGDEF)-like protein
MKTLLGIFRQFNRWILSFRGKPFFEALRFFIFYILLGIIWILWSDQWLAAIVDDYALFIELQTYKGWFYVIISGLLFFVILRSRLALLKEMSDRLIHQATTDELTKLPNKSKLTNLIDEIIRNNKENVRYALISLDLDDFSNINELLGYHIGDQLISSIANQIKPLIRSEDIFGRDSDGFVLFVNIDTMDDTQLISFLENIQKSVNQPWNIANQMLFITCTLGISKYPKDGANFAELYKSANAAIHQLKEKGKNDYHFFTEKYHVERVERVTMMNELRKSLDQHQLHMVFQPIYQMITGRVVGFEALVRWNSPTFGDVSPAVFIEYSENTGLIHMIDEFVFESVIRVSKQWFENGYDQVMLSLNCSAKGIVNSGLMKKVKNWVEQYEIDPHYIQVEITETALIANFETAIENLRFLKELGFSIALDDFGSGYSSLTYLQSLPIDTLKIDRSFTKNIGNDIKQDVILETIISLADELNLKLVIEGIESQTQKDYLIMHDCLFGQGYFFSRPMDMDNACELIRNDFFEANDKTSTDMI